MGSFERKLKRGNSKKVAKLLKKSMTDIIEETMKAKMESYSRLPDSCTACSKPFDKTDREQVFSWMMQIHEEQEIYNLYCPPCYEEIFNGKNTEQKEGDNENE